MLPELAHRSQLCRLFANPAIISMPRFRPRIDRRSFLRTAVLGGAALTFPGCRTTSPAAASNEHSRTVAQPDPRSRVERSQGRPGAAIDTHIHLVHGNPNLKPIPEEMEQLTRAPAEVKARRLRAE